jgi:taurine dioxygenase
MTSAKNYSYEVTPLSERFDWGVNIHGLEISSLLDAKLRRALYDLWIDKGLMVFKGGYSSQDQLALSRVFGPLLEHTAAREAIAEEARELVDIQFEPEKGQLALYRGEIRGQPLPWHSDLIYLDKINHGGILRPITLPKRGGETGFLDKISAYRDLSDDIKSRIESLHVVYQYDMDQSKIKFGPDRGMKMIRLSPVAAAIQRRIHEYPRAIHPLVFTQYETGRKVLNLSPWFAVGILEMPNEDGDELLELLAQHIAADKRAYYHKWDLQEMVLWDNWRMLHSAKGNPVEEVRHLQRTTIGGDYGLGSRQDSSGANEGALQYLHV